MHELDNSLPINTTEQPNLFSDYVTPFFPSWSYLRAGHQQNGLIGHDERLKLLFACFLYSLTINCLEILEIASLIPPNLPIHLSINTEFKVTGGTVCLIDVIPPFISTGLTWVNFITNTIGIFLHLSPPSTPNYISPLTSLFRAFTVSQNILKNCTLENEPSLNCLWAEGMPPSMNVLTTVWCI